MLADQPNENLKSLLWSYQIETDGSYQNITPALFGGDNGAYRWTHLQSDSEDAHGLMEAIGLSAPVCDTMSALETRPKAFQMDNGLLVFLRGINRNQDAEEEDMVSLRIWFDEHNIVTARRRNRKLKSVQDTRLEMEAGNVPNSPGQLILDIVERIANGICDVVDVVDDELTEFEAEGGIEGSDRIHLSNLRRKAAAIRRYLAPQRDALEALHRINKVFTSHQLFELRELTDRMTRYVEDLDLAKERAMLLQEELRNRIADQQGMRMYVLSLVTAIFLPLSFLTGVFGMNVAGLPGTENGEAFTYLASAMGGLAVLMLVAMVWKKWL